MSKNNDIIEQQRKARQEFLNLKKMQQGELESPQKPSEEAVLQMTFKDKMKNFWYYFKWQTIITVFLAIVLVIAVSQCVSREKYDYQILYFPFQIANDSEIDNIEKYFETLSNDIDGDGNVNIGVINCSVNPDSRDMNYRNTMFSKVQSVLVAEKTAVLYLIDDKSKEYFDNAFETSIFFEEPLKLDQDFYEKTKVTQKNIMLGLRRIDETGFEGNENAERTFDECKTVLNKIKIKTMADSDF